MNTNHNKQQRPRLNIIDRFDNPDVSMWELFQSAEASGITENMAYSTFKQIVDSRTNPTQASLLIVARILGLDDAEFLEEQGIKDNIPASMISNLFNQDIGFKFEPHTGKVIAYDTERYQITTTTNVTINKVQK